MVRLLNYVLTLVIVFAFLSIVIPFGLLGFASKEYLSSNYTDQFVPSSISDLQNFNMAGSLSSMIIFMVVGFAILYVQQHYWIIFTRKGNYYEVPNKFIFKYRYVGICAGLTLTFGFVFALIAWAIPIGSATDINNWSKFYYIRQNIYIAFIVITGAFGLFTMGLSSFVNLQIAYDQQIKLVDEGIENGTYDPITRLPIEQTVHNDIKIENVEKNKDDEASSSDKVEKNNDLEQLSTSGFFAKSKEKHIEDEQAK